MPPEIPNPSTREVKQQATQAAQVAASRRGVGQVARLGYFSIGTVYALMGVLALLGIAGVGGGQFTGSAGAMRTVMAQPYGRVLLGIIGAGLVVYVCWRFAQSILDVEGRGHDTSGLLSRFGLALSGLSYAGLAVIVIERLVLGGGSVEDPKEGLVKAIMSVPAGLVLVGLIGVVVLGAALVQFRMAYQAGFLDALGASERTKRWISGLGRFGLTARGVVFGIIGVFMIISAVQTDPSEAKSLHEAIHTLEEQPYGYWMIGLVALGFLSFGSFMIAKAGYRHLVPAEREDDRDQEGNRDQRSDQTETPDDDVDRAPPGA